MVLLFSLSHIAPVQSRLSRDAQKGFFGWHSLSIEESAARRLDRSSSLDRSAPTRKS